MNIKVETELISKYNIGDVIIYENYDGYYSIGIIDDIEPEFNNETNSYIIKYYIMDIDIPDPANSNNIQKIRESNICFGVSLDKFDDFRQKYIRRRECEEKWRKDYEKKIQDFATNYDIFNSESDRM